MHETLHNVEMEGKREGGGKESKGKGRRESEGRKGKGEKGTEGWREGAGKGGGKYIRKINRASVMR